MHSPKLFFSVLTAALIAGCGAVNQNSVPAVSQTSPPPTGTTGSSGSAAVFPHLANAFTSINLMSGWQNCGSCSGPNGQGPQIPYSMTQFVNSPSLSGGAVQFSVAGAAPYGSALWWRQLGPQPQATHFLLDFDFYLLDESSVQALEFDMNQTVNGLKYIFGTQCNVRGGGQWDVWDTANAHWVKTQVACPVPKAGVWHHLTIEAERVATQTRFVAIALDGTKNDLDLYFESKPVNAAELNVAVQLDENYAAANYSLWVDNITLAYQ